MKLFSTLILAAALAPAVSAAMLTIDSVRQRWPFSSKVDIAFTVSGADDDYYALTDFKVYDGARLVDNPGVFAFGNVRPAYTNGSYTITYDPSRSLLTNTVAVQRFHVSFDVTPKPVRYLVLDLAKRVGEPGAVEYVYSDDARLETFEQKVDYLDAGGTARQTSIRYDGAFLAVTNGTVELGDSAQTKASPYLLTKMAFRLVKPGAYRVGKGAIGASAGNAVTFTKPYFISVFPLTRAQYGMIRYGDWMQGDTERTSDANVPAQIRAYSDSKLDRLRGRHGDATYPVDWIQYGHAVCPTSLVGVARAKYGLGFDLATEAQWEVACRAGTTGYYYVDAEITDANASLLGKIGVTPTDDDSQIVLGTRFANAWGLFDMLGGKGEVLLDHSPGTGDLNAMDWPSGTDPSGVWTSWSGWCISRGGGHHEGAPVSCGLRSASAKDSTVTGDWFDPYYLALRLVINAN